MDLKEIVVNTRNFINSAQDRYYWRVLVNMALNLRVPKAMELLSDLNSKINCPSQETEETTRPVENVALTTKGLQERK